MTTPAVLPPNWAAFVESVAVGMSPTEAAKRLGFERPASMASALMQLPDVRMALVAATEARLEGVLAPLAAQVAEEILLDDGAPKAVRAKLALGILDRVRGQKVTRADRETPEGDSLSEMRDLVERMERAMRAGSDAVVVPHTSARNKPGSDE